MSFSRLSSLAVQIYLMSRRLGVTLSSKVEPNLDQTVVAHRRRRTAVRSNRQAVKMDSSFQLLSSQVTASISPAARP